MLTTSSPRSRMRCQVSGDACCRLDPVKGRTERHPEAGIDLSQLSRLGELGQRPVDLHQELCILGPHRQGHVPALARHVLGHEPQAELGMTVQVPGGEVGVQECGVEPAGLEAVQQLFARLEASHRVVLLRDGHRAGHDPDPLAAEIGQGTEPSRVARDHQTELGAGIGNAPGHVARRPGLVRLAEHHVAAAGGQAMPGALRRWRTSGIRSSAPECGPRAAPRPHPGPLVYRPGLCRSGASTPARRRRSGPSRSRRAPPVPSLPSRLRASNQHHRRRQGPVTRSAPRPDRDRTDCHLPSSGRAKTNRVFPRRALRSQGAPSPANPAVQPPQPTHTAMYCRPSRL